ncbi:MAG: 3-phosphoshikimate 1-carboxyvinyltransferase [Methanomicrobiaceae archaeon]|nr:3-phosphoshikimate 1-carboxyvinyltransferase [Methanomicrobiaceae archaeon]
MNVTVGRVRDIDCRVSAPPSKSYSHRALIIAAIADGTSVIERILDAGDIRVTYAVLSRLGISTEREEDRVIVEGCGGMLPAAGPVSVGCGESGTTLRLCAGIAALGTAPVLLDGSTRMRERPVGPLGDALATLGAGIRYTGTPGYPPVEVTGPLSGGTACMDGRISSQFVSSVLIASPCARSAVSLQLSGDPVSHPYIDITTAVMEKFGVRVARRGYRSFSVSPGRYAARRYVIEGDWSSASYFFGIAAASGGRMTVDLLNPASPQGDRMFIDALSRMGCRVSLKGDSVTVERTGPLRGIEIDMSSSPDTVQTLAAVAAYAESPTRISGIGHLRYKESDRIAATATMLRACGAEVETGADFLTIHPRPLHGAVVDPGQDHRTAMAGAILGYGTGDVTIRDAECTDKSFPGFWESLREAGL